MKIPLPNRHIKDPGLNKFVNSMNDSTSGKISKIDLPKTIKPSKIKPSKKK
jgi:hypothetical protein